MHPTLVVMEPNHTGHRMQYALWITRSVTAQGTKVVLATASTTLKSPEFSSRFSPDEMPEIFDLGPREHARSWRHELWVVNRLRAVMAAYPGSTVLVPEGDRVLPYLWLLSPASRRRLRVLVMRVPPKTTIIRFNSIPSAFKRATLRMHSRGGRIRVLAPSMLTAPSYEWRGFPAVPDPIEITRGGAPIPSLRGEAAVDMTWLGVFGAINPRKNVVEVISAMTEAASPEQVALLLAGKVEPTYEPRLATAIERARHQGYTIVSADRFLTNEELDSAIESVDIAVAAHSNDAPSGTFGKAVAVGTFVVAAGPLALSEAIEKLGDGALYTNLNHHSLVAALREAIEIAPGRPRLPRELAGPSDFVQALLS